MPRDASRLRVQLPLIDDTGDGTPTTTTDTYVCVTGNLSWTGLSRDVVRSDCSETTLDAFGNLIKSYIGGKEIEGGEISFDADFMPDLLTTASGRLLAAFYSGLVGNYKFRYPAAVGETTGPIITVPACVTKFTPMTPIMTTGDESRSRCSITLKVAGAITITAAV
jgi:hypothetical protein